MREDREIKMDGARPVKNSGRGVRKGDAVLHDLLIDYKDYTESFTINRKKWKKHAKDAWNDGQYTPCFSVCLNAKEIKSHDDKPVYLGVVPWERLKQLLEAEEELERINGEA